MRYCNWAMLLGGLIYIARIKTIKINRAADEPVHLQNGKGIM
jgi:hypothetical protein